MARPQHISDDSIVEALAAGGEVTAAEVAKHLGMGQSTATKRLATLEGTGSVRRHPGGRVNGVRVPDHWSVPAADPAASDSGGTAGPDSSDQGETTRSGTERLGRGALGTLVREYLAARPDEEFGPTQVGKALGRSQGAVSNALGRLEAAGEARLVSITPRRYRIVPGR